VRSACTTHRQINTAGLCGSSRNARSAARHRRAERQVANQALLFRTCCAARWELVAEIRSIEESLQAIEAELAQIARQSEDCERLRRIPGIGLIAATALVGAVGDIGSFRNGRRFASWLGLTPREHSSGNVRRLGSITKRGDKYLRTLLVHGARSVIFSAKRGQTSRQALGRVPPVGSEIRVRCGHNKAVIAVANKIARIIWASWYRQRDFEFRAPAAAAAA
jgi:transposase